MKRLYILFALIALIAASCTRELAPEVEEQDPVPVEADEQIPAIVPGQAIVQFDDAMIELIESDLEAGNVVTKSSELNAIQEMLGIESMTRVFSHGGEFEARRRAAGLHKWYNVQFRSDVPVTKAAADLEMVGGVVSVEPVRNIRRTTTFDDPRLKYQWHYYNDGSLDSSYKPGADVNVVPVWENYTVGKPDVIVAVVDAGIDGSHEDLKANYLKGKSFVKGVSKIVVDDHGTHVAGTIAAVNNNGIGVSGLAGGDAANEVSGVKLLSCQIFAPDPADPNVTIGGNEPEAIAWGADNGAVISQNSWGYVYESAEDAAKGKIPSALAAAVDYFIENAGKDAAGNQVGPMAGGIVIFASGNDGWQYNPICEYEPILTVGAIAPDFTRAYYSNYGDWVDIAAPGGSYEYSGGQIQSTIAGNKYGYMQGTSMACPHVSGVAALVVSHHGGPGFTASKLREKLVKGANSSVMSKNAKIGPLVDALGAITYGGKTPPNALASADVKAQSNNINLAWSVTSDPDDNKAWGYRIVVSDRRDFFASSKPGTLPEGTVYLDALTGSVKLGEEMTAVVSGLDFDATYYVAAAAFDYRRNYSAYSPVYQVVTEGNNPPVVSSENDGEFQVKAHETLEVKYTVADPDGHAVKVDYAPASDADVFELQSDGKYIFRVTGNADEPGKYKSVLTVTDIYGLKSVCEINFEILENHAPVIVKELEDKFFDQTGMKFSLDMSEFLNDPDGEQLKFDIKMSNPAVLHINPSQNVLHATTLMYGNAEVTIMASDSRGLSCTLTFKVVVKDPEKPLEVFPNPVVDWLNISTLDVVPTHIQIVSVSGKSMYDEILEVGAVEPAKIDMSACAPGVYTLKVSFSGEVYKRTIVKL